jgi:hypothetical protein
MAERQDKAETKLTLKATMLILLQELLIEAASV